MDQMIKLDVDDRLEYERGYCRLRIYRHQPPVPLLGPAAVVLVTEWHYEPNFLGGEERRLAGAIQDAYGVPIYDADRTAFIVRYNSLLPTPNGHVPCETWDRLDVGVGTSRWDMSRAEVVKLIGHPLNEPIEAYHDPLEWIKGQGIEIPEEEKGQVLQEIADIAAEHGYPGPTWEKEGEVLS